jgi:WD40 repeat protein
VSPNGGTLLVPEYQVKLCDLGTFKVRMIEDRVHHWSEVAMSGNGRLLAIPSGSFEEIVVRLRDVASGKEVRAVATTLTVTGCRFSPGDELLALYGDKGFQLWDTATGTLLTSVNGHRGRVAGVAFSPDGGTLVSAGFAGTLLVWDVAALLRQPSPR